MRKYLILIFCFLFFGCEKWRRGIYPIKSPGFQAQEWSFEASTCDYLKGVCNPCASGVLQQIAQLATKQGESYTHPFVNKELGIGFSPFKHTQGIGRIPGLDNENWLLIPRHHHRKVAEAGIISVEYPSIESQGKAWRQNSQGHMRHFYSTHDNHHPGGCQMIGQTLVVAHENGQKDLPAQSWISFYDAKNPKAIKEVNRLYLDGTDAAGQSFPIIAKGQATCVAISRLPNQHYLLFALDSRESLKKKKGWFFLSTSTDLQQTDWVYRQFWQQQETLPHEDSWQTYHNIGLIEDCQDGQLYLCAYAGKGTKNVIDVFQLLFQESGTIALKKVMEKKVFTRSKGASFRAGSTLHISPDHELILYAVEKDEKGRWMMVEEFVKK
ncbi:MAG: hypothetical protein AAF985_25835 [Bacteroidota bacterium]